MTATAYSAEKPALQNTFILRSELSWPQLFHFTDSFNLYNLVQPATSIGKFNFDFHQRLFFFPSRLHSKI